MRGFLKFFFAATFGAIYGLLFAQKPGKKLRSELKKAENPLKILLEEGKKTEKEARNIFMNWAENCDELQQILSTGKTQFNNFVEQGKKLTEEGKEKAIKKLEELSENAKKSAKELKKTFEEKGKDLQEEVKDSGAKFQNQIKKGVKTIADKMEK